MTPAIFSVVMSIESRLVMSDKNQTKPPDLRNCEAWRWSRLFAIIVVCYHPFLILFPSLNKFTPVLDDIIPFVTINIHPPLFASIPPIQFVKPSLCRPETNPSVFQTEHALYLFRSNKIYNILGAEVSILGNFNKMELDTLRYVLVFQGGRAVAAGEMKGELARCEVFVNPSPNAASSITAIALGFCDKQTCLSPCVQEFGVKV